MPSFMAKWSAQYPGCSGHCHQSLSDGKRTLPECIARERELLELTEQLEAANRELLV